MRLTIRRSKMQQTTNNISSSITSEKLSVLSNVQTLRARARQDIEEGAVTSGYAADRKIVITLLNEALATELVCVLRYKRHYFMAKGIHSESIKAEFLQHSIEEMAHADRLAKRITELGGEPDFSPDGLSERSHAEYVAGDTLNAMIKEDLIAERIAIESYREMIAYLADADPTTQQLLKDILAMEEEHAEDLASLMGNIKNEITSLVM
jgi:bacterioferritin